MKFVRHHEITNHMTGVSTRIVLLREPKSLMYEAHVQRSIDGAAFRDVHVTDQNEHDAHVEGVAREWHRKNPKLLPEAVAG